jgi:hypothetical protein
VQSSPTPPVTAGTVVEEVAGAWRRWARAMLAASASLAVLFAGAALWEYGRRAGDATPVNPRDVLFFASLGHFGGEAWLRRRPRRADLRWRRALPLPGMTRPGFVAPRSGWALVVDAVGLSGTYVGFLVLSGSTVDGWMGRIGTALCLVLTPLAAYAVFQRLHRPVLVALTSRGVVAEMEDMPWERIGSVRRDKDGVHLRLVEDGEGVRYVTVGGPDCAVSDERLARVIEYHLANPHRRVALDVSAPGPLPAVR